MRVTPLRMAAGLAASMLAAGLWCVSVAAEGPPPAASSTPQAAARIRHVPLGLDLYVPIPGGNPLTADKAALGRRLFFDPILSDDGELSCAGCHDPERAFTDGKSVAEGVGGRRGTRNAPTLVNRRYGSAFFLDGRAASIEEQVLQPLEGRNELATRVDTAVERLRTDREYRRDFERVFGRAPDSDALAAALASYVRTIVSGDAPVDRYGFGDLDALSELEREGQRVFHDRAGCSACHGGPNFSDEAFHNTGVAWRPAAGAGDTAPLDAPRDEGRFAVTGEPRDRGAFKTPTLREVARTAPYMHDGSLATLEDVVDFYNGGGQANPDLDSRVRPLDLSDREKAALLAFLRALSGEISQGDGFATLGQSAGATTPSWPGFRGPTSAGRTVADDPYPTRFAPDESGMVWTRELSEGHSSPAIWGDALFVTGSNREAGWLEVLRFDRRDGRLVWRRELPVSEFQNSHEMGSPADATPATDGERLYVYFGSLGVLAFDFDGRELWRVPLPVVDVPYGSGTSPALAGDLVIVSREGRERYVLALDRRTGATVWKHEHGDNGCGIGHATPVAWKDQVVLNRCREVVSLDARTGERRWWLAWGAGSGDTTVAFTDELIFATAWTNMGEPDLVRPFPPFADALGDFDRNGDGLLSEAELPELTWWSRVDAGDTPGARFVYTFSRLDRDSNGTVDADEWARVAANVLRQRDSPRDHGLIAIKPDGQGALPAEALVWKEPRSVSEIPSPLVYRGKVYMVSNGGIVSTFEAASGRLLYRARLGAPGLYYASPVASGGHVYFASGEGVVTVIADGEALDVVARNDLGDPIMATPALVDGHIYVRTTRRLYAFGGSR